MVRGCINHTERGGAGRKLYYLRRVSSDTVDRLKGGGAAPKKLCQAVWDPPLSLLP